jgi:NAD(P)-dependent dehydrogenase (short-subunit alcohol dehydrogenase family)
MKTVLITGTNSGIGFETAKAMADKGYRIIMLCRNKEKAHQAVETILKVNPNAHLISEFANLESMNETHHIAHKIADEHGSPDILINNAGAYFSKHRKTDEGLEVTFATNFLSHYVLTKCLTDKKPKNEMRLIHVTSQAHILSRIDFHQLQSLQQLYGIKAYACSKLLMLMYSNHLSKLGFRSYAVHPGGVNTGFGKNVDGFTGLLFKYLGFMMKTPQQGADSLIWLADAENIPESGSYIINRKVSRPSPISSHLQKQEILISYCEHLLQQIIR